MQLFKYIERINLIDKLIRQRRTGTPAVLARRLGISVSRLYAILDQLKCRGAPIRYCRDTSTYFYEEEFAISITITLEQLKEPVVRKISGGYALFTNFFATTFFVE
ncbi:hypothetical protein M8998_14850 [Sphingobacterium sp. lm-10]|uniref:hypothetical protein n=1 Tax=Sphingobacterium sp. lm-10 TaxID=2944904 RepID=UPI0020212922|nr:hypothetical protein [Sphingobacterium sp. lm-10]MCL7989226.1 hypothetical protein [Sphingobacterium sp. lm-10]